MSWRSLVFDQAGDVNSAFHDTDETNLTGDDDFDVALKGLYSSEDFNADELKQMGNEDLSKTTKNTGTRLHLKTQKTDIPIHIKNIL